MDERYPLQELKRLHVRVETGDDYPGGTHQCYSSLCAKVSTLELSLVMVDGNVWKPARVPALRLGTALRNVPVLRAPLSPEFEHYLCKLGLD